MRRQLPGRWGICALASASSIVDLFGAARCARDLSGRKTSDSVIGYDSDNDSPLTDEQCKSVQFKIFKSLEWQHVVRETYSGMQRRQWAKKS